MFPNRNVGRTEPPSNPLDATWGFTMNKRLQEASKFVSSAFQVLFPSILCQTHRSRQAMNPAYHLVTLNCPDTLLSPDLPGPLANLTLGEQGRSRRRKNDEKWGHQDLAKFLDFYIYGYGSIPIDTFLVGWTSIYQLFWCSPGVQGFDTLPYIYIYIYQQSTKKTQMHQSYIHIHKYLPLYWLILTMILALDMASRGLLHLWPQP
jgi:hypothetical protein